jgi:digeranylgeranylglycerophospholipid reductase
MSHIFPPPENLILHHLNLLSVNCDVLVVGASSAGLMAAISAASSGADVILVDRPPSGIGPEHAANTIFSGMATASGIKIEDCYLKHDLEGMQILSPSGRTVRIPARGFFLDRKRFDEHYRSLAQSCGVSMFSGTVKEAKLQGSRRVVSLDDCEDDGRIDARVVVDASGVTSSLARENGLQPMLHREDIAWAMEADIELKDLGEEKFFQYWIGSMAPGWKATFSPAGGDRATLGVFVRGHGENVQPFFRSFLKRFKAYKAARYRDIESLKIHSIRRGGDPIAVLPGEIVADSLMVTGGAAGQSGLAYSMRAGSICGLVAAEASKKLDVSKKSLSRYEKLWKKEFYWQYRMARASLDTLASMKDNEIDRLVAGLSAKNLISCGSFARKAAYASVAVALSRPKTLPDLAANLMRG